MTPTKTHNDDGFSLIELVVSTLLFSLVMITVVSIIISATAAERTVRTVSSATSAGQLVTRSMQDGITNAPSPVTVTVSGSDIWIKASTASRSSTLAWKCSYWYYSASNKTIRTTTSSSALTVSAANQLTWTLLADGIGLITTSAAGVTPVVTAPVFAVTGSAPTVVSVNFTVSAGQTKPVAFSSKFSAQSTSGGTTC